MKNITGYIEAAGICKAKVVEITKQDAADILQLNTANRKISANNVNYLRKSMDDGRWMFNGDTIVLDSCGKLKSGQHRLTAFIASKLESMTVLLVNLLNENDVLLSLNRGARLTPSQYLAVKGFKNSKDFSTIGGILLSIEAAIGGHGNIASAYKDKKLDYEIENIIKSIPAELVDEVNTGHHTTLRISAALAGTMIFAAMRYPEASGIIRKAWGMVRNGDTPKHSLAWGIMRVNLIRGAGAEKCVERIEKTFSVIRSCAVSGFVPDRIYSLNVDEFISQMDMAKSMRQGIFAASNQEG